MYHVHPDSRLLTCRYWALGRGCPNVDNQKVEYCDYAHRDTGKLCPWEYQPGTCVDWLHRTCPRGTNCGWEHRYTGIQGFNQGVLLLNGSDLQIADAAAGSGFDTRNHDALTNLLWAVKRVSRRPHLTHQNRSNGRKHQQYQTNRHRIYPDRYRPSGIGDTSKRNYPGSRLARGPVSPPPFHPIPTLGSTSVAGRKNTRNETSTNIPANQQTQTGNRKKAEPHHDGQGSVLHRVQDHNARISKSKSFTLPRRPSALTTNRNPSLRSSRIEQQAGGTQTNPISLSDSDSENIITNPKHNHKQTNIEPSTSTSNLPPQNILTTLTTVKSTLTSTSNTMTQIENTMKLLFDHHNNANTSQLSNDAIFPLMRNLADAIHACRQSSLQGADSANEAMAWFEIKKEEENTKREDEDWELIL